MNESKSHQHLKWAQFKEQIESVNANTAFKAQHLAGGHIITSNSIHQSRSYQRTKRILDLILTLLLMLPICVIILIIMILIRLDTKGSALLRQKRVGQDGVEFEMFKLRSMYADSDDKIHRQAIKRYMSGETLNSEIDLALPYKLIDDSRITRIGRLIRKTGLDELPQFFNVLHGEMSLVGPRPPLPYEVELYTPHEWLRLSGKPGLTGTWQVYGRSQVPFQNMVEMDIEYLHQQSLLLDIKIIALTPFVMISGRGGG